MKKIIFCAGFLLVSFCGFSQEKNTTKTHTPRNVNELKIDLFALATFSGLNAEYERMLNAYASYGANFSLREYSFSYGYSAHAFYRTYFISGQDYEMEGVFWEAFLGAYGHWDTENQDLTRKISPAVGFSVGKKWVSRKGFVFQIHLGGGRKLDGGFTELQGGIYLGYRFPKIKK